MFLDFDWAGREGVAQYPLGLPSGVNTALWEAIGLRIRPHDNILRAHDIAWLTPRVVAAGAAVA